MIGVLCIATLLLSCNDKLWDELDRVEQINQAQADRLQQLSDEIDSLQNTINILTDNVYSSITEINSMIDDIETNVSVNTAEIVDITERLQAQADGLVVAIESIHILDEETAFALELVEGQITNIEGDIDALQDEDDVIVGLLNSAVSDLETAISEIEVFHVTNITEIYDDTEIKSDIVELFCDTAPDVEDYTLPDLEAKYQWKGVYTDNSKTDTLGIIALVQWGKFGEDAIYRHIDYNTGDWVGVFGHDYDSMELPHYDYSETYHESIGIGSPIKLPSLGEIAQLGETVSGTLAFDYDGGTGEYKGCADDYVVWYVNGVEIDKGANAKFFVGLLDGEYIITAVYTDGSIAQHVVTLEKDITLKAGFFNYNYKKRKGRVKPKKPII